MIHFLESKLTMISLFVQWNELRAFLIIAYIWLGGKSLVTVSEIQAISGTAGAKLVEPFGLVAELRGDTPP